jgi:hypothetical protein
MNYNPEKSMGLGVARGDDYIVGRGPINGIEFQPVIMTLCLMHHFNYSKLISEVASDNGGYIEEVATF